MNEELLEFINQDITFCMEECDNEECFRNKNNAKIDWPHSFAYLRNTEYCPLNNSKEQEKTS